MPNQETADFERRMRKQYSDCAGFRRFSREKFKGADLYSNWRPRRAPAPLKNPRNFFKGAASASKARTFRRQLGVPAFPGAPAIKKSWQDHFRGLPNRADLSPHRVSRGFRYLSAGNKLASAASRPKATRLI